MFYQRKFLQFLCFSSARLVLGASGESGSANFQRKMHQGGKLKI